MGDIDAVVETMATAFAHDPVWGAYSFPDPVRQPEQSRRFWRACLEAEMRFPWTWVTARCEAAAVWIPPGEPEMTPEQEERFAELVEELLGPEQAAVVLGAFALLDRHHPHEPSHYYLSLLATHDDHRGGGIGMALLGHCLEQIDRERMPAYLESTNPANDHRYMRHGFRPHGTITLPSGHVVTTMWRDPR